MKKMLIGVGGWILASAASASILSASVVMRLPDGRKCSGTCIDSKGPSVVASVAHCATDAYTGGLSLNGVSSMEVIMPVAQIGDGHVPQDKDFALFIFPAGTCNATVAMDQSMQQTGSTVTVVKDSSEHTETIQDVGSIFIQTSNRSGMRPGDSGSGLFSQAGKFLGALRGCADVGCGFYNVWKGNDGSHEVLQNAMKKGYIEWSVKLPNSSPGTPVVPQVKKLFACEATCRITYGGQFPDERDYHMSASYISAMTVAEAYSIGVLKLQDNCSENCRVSRDAETCRITSQATCRQMGIGF